MAPRVNPLKESIKNSELLKKASESSYLKELIRYMPGHVYWKDREGYYLGCNEILSKLSGISLEDIVGKTAYDFLEKEHADKVAQIDESIMKDGYPVTIEEQGLDSNGEDAIYLTQKVPLHDEQGSVTGMVGISIDITHIKKMEKILREAKEKAEAGSIAKSLFLATMSHEFRTPLNGVMGMAQLLLMEVEVPEIKEKLNEILRAGSYLLGMVTEILDFSKLEADKFELEEKTFSLKQCLSETTAHLRYILGNNTEIDLISNFSEDLPEYIKGDEKALKRILFNLGSNAIKFTKKGKVIIKVNLVLPSFLLKHLNDNQQGKMSFNPGLYILHIEVLDTGIGIAQDKLQNIFQYFTQVDSNYNRGHGGAGLGLAITKKIIEAHGSRINVESKLGEGSRFWCELSYPAANTEEIEFIKKTYQKPFHAIPGSQGLYSSLVYHSVGTAEKKLETEKPLFSDIKTSENFLHEKNCIIVEDEKINQMVLKGMIESWGGQVEIFVNAQSALFYLENSKKAVDIILTDIGLPDMEGTELIEKLRQNKQYKNTPIFAITGYSAQKDINRFLKSGADKVLNKPISSDLLKEAIMNIQDCLQEEVPKAPLSDVFSYEKTLRQLGGDKNTATRLLRIFLKELPEYLTEIESYISEKNGISLSEIAHKLKGGCAALAIDRLKEAASMLEKGAKGLGFNAHVAIIAEECLDEIKITKKALEEWENKIN